jgi:hypothetical protein
MHQLLSVTGLAQLLDVTDQLVVQLANNGTFEVFAVVDGQPNNRLFESAKTSEFERKLNDY